jgi:HK97 family phage major capsid protein
VKHKGYTFQNDFDSLGQQLQAIVNFEKNGKKTTDDRLIGTYYHLGKPKNAAIGINETIGSEGGFLLRPTFGEGIMQKVYDNSALLNLCDKFEPERFSEFIIPRIDETSRANGSRLGGVVVSRVAEGDPITNSKPKLGQWVVNAIKIAGLVYFTDELLKDAPMMEKVFIDSFGRETTNTLEKEIYRGDGVGQCQGVLNSDALITVSKEANQPAKTILITNLEKMWARCWGPSRGKSIWAFNQNAEQQILDSVKNTRFFDTGDPYNTLFGRPLVPMEACSTLGTKGDISLICPDQYGIVKEANPKIEVSAHIEFITGQLALRYILTVSGQSKWSEPVCPENTDGTGNDTQSPFITLEMRS